MTWTRRKTDMGSDVRNEIMEAISADGDVPQRTMLKLMLMVLDDIGGKIDAILQDETSLRHAVLNGHTEQHEAHHDWIAAQMESQAANKKSARNIIESMVEKVLYSGLVFMAGAVAMKVLG